MKGEKKNHNELSTYLAIRVMDLIMQSMWTLGANATHLRMIVAQSAIGIQCAFLSPFTVHYDRTNGS